MKIQITLNIDNSAYDVFPKGKGIRIDRALMTALFQTKIREGEDGSEIIDANGNTVGRVELVD